MTLLNTYSSPACPKLKVYVFRVVVAGRYLGVDSTDLLGTCQLGMRSRVSFLADLLATC